MRSAIGLVVLAVIVAVPASRGDDFKLEPGFKLLFNGKDLSGWKEATYKKQDDKTPLEAKAESSTKRFRLEKGVLFIDDKVKGDLVLFTADDLGGDGVIRFDFLPGEKCNNDLLWRGIKYDVKAETKGVKLNEWNTFEMTVAGKKTEVKINGEAQKAGDAKADKGPFGIRAEFGPIQIKNLRVKAG